MEIDKITTKVRVQRVRIRFADELVLSQSVKVVLVLLFFSFLFVVFCLFVCLGSLVIDFMSVRSSRFLGSSDCRIVLFSCFRPPAVNKWLVWLTGHVLPCRALVLGWNLW